MANKVTLTLVKVGPFLCAYGFELRGFEPVRYRIPIDSPRHVRIVAYYQEAKPFTVLEGADEPRGPFRELARQQLVRGPDGVWPFRRVPRGTDL